MKVSISFVIISIALSALLLIFLVMRKLNWRSALMLTSCATVLWLSLELRAYLRKLLDGNIEILVDSILVLASLVLVLSIYYCYLMSERKGDIPNDK